MRIDGTATIITGGSRGIGKAIALALAGNGADIIVNYVTRSEEAEDVVQTAHSMGVDAIAVRADISDYDQAKMLVDTAKKEFGRVDILVNNAGIVRDKTLRKLTKEDWDNVIKVNLSGAFYCTRHAVGYMIEQGAGKIVMVSSIIGRAGNIGQSNYAASKAGLVGFMKSIAYELARHNIMVSAVAPGFIETDMITEVPEEIKNQIKSQIPLRRFGKPEEVADAVMFLIKNDFVTGEVLYIDGGQFAPSYPVR